MFRIFPYSFLCVFVLFIVWFFYATAVKNTNDKFNSNRIEIVQVQLYIPDQTIFDCINSICRTKKKNVAKCII